MKNLSKFFYLLFFLLFFSEISLIKPILAQVPVPYVDCDKTDDPEFNSLRPYQSSPCNLNFEDLSYICGNNLRVIDNIVVSPNSNCVVSSSGAVCHYNLNRSFNFSVDPNESELPIAGNTEGIKNSQSPDENISDVSKVNEYVSWYLNGVINRAEYGDTKNTDSEVVNFSGPLKKLLPSVIQDAERIKVIENVSSKQNHDQIVVCAQEGFLGILGKSKPHECYSGNNSSAKSDVYKLESWDGNLSIFRSLSNYAFGADAWDKRIPQLPWDFDEEIEYKKAFLEWKGKACAILPLVGLQCIDTPLVANKWAELFPYVPLSTTEDNLGKLTVQDAVVEESGDVEVTNIKTSWRNKTGGDPTAPENNESALSFAHMGEDVSLVDQLQSTYLPQNQIGLSQVAENTKPVTVDPNCKILEIRYNEGDQLFGELITADVTYNAKFDCAFPIGPTGLPIGTCTKPVTFSSEINVGSPKIDELWGKTVASNVSVLKRIFPKIEAGAPIEEIVDVPGLSSVVHSTSGELVSVNPEIYIPHLGGIIDYFLKSIQVALRPKGFGELTTATTGSGTETTNNVACNNQTTLPDLPAANEVACKICGYTLAPTFQAIIESAAQTFGVPGSVILGTIYHEGAFSRGINWSEENVIKWALCGGEVPGCDKNSSAAQIPFGWIPHFFYEDNALWSAVQVVDPTRTKETVSPCNVLDGIYATAKALSMWSGGLSTSYKYSTSLDPTQTYSLFPDTCYNWDLNNGIGAVTSCSSWNENTVATSQVGYGGYCPEPGKHPIGSAFPDNNQFIHQTISYFNSNTCK